MRSIGRSVRSVCFKKTLSVSHAKHWQIRKIREIRVLKKNIIREPCEALADP